MSRGNRGNLSSACPRRKLPGRMTQSEAVMIELTEQQRQAMEGPEPLGVIDPQAQRTYVLVPTNLYERLTELLYDSGSWTDEEMDLLAAEDADSLGWDGMEAYQDPG